MLSIMKILYIHNNPVPVLIRKMRGLGNVEIAKNEFMGLYCLHSYTPDLVVFHEDSLDNTFYKFISNCRGIAQLKDTKFVMLTSKITKQTMHKKQLLFDVFTTPVDLELFETRLEFLTNHIQEIKRMSNEKSLFSVTKKINFKGFTGKRAMDVLASSFAILLLSPLLLLTAIAVRLDSKGPIIYKSKRVGKGYKIFSLYKFRTMRIDADKLLNQIKESSNLYKSESSTVQLPSNPYKEDVILYNDNDKIISESEYLTQKMGSNSNFIKINKDPRITRIGNFLRNTSIDELPQLFNILLGDMSLVGNRPLPLYEAETLTSDASIKRFLAPAGLTGLWQVTKRGKRDVSAKERIELDNEYAEKCSFLFDMKIILKTFPALFQTESV